MVIYFCFVLVFALFITSRTLINELNCFVVISLQIPAWEKVIDSDWHRKSMLSVIWALKRRFLTEIQYICFFTWKRFEMA
jgi:hypothetical protein